MAVDIGALVGTVLEEAIDAVVAEGMVASVDEEYHGRIHVTQRFANGALFFTVGVGDGGRGESAAAGGGCARHCGRLVVGRRYSIFIKVRLRSRRRETESDSGRSRV